uniref:DNA-directed RNA polymerase subunit beta'' n=1 Tax=Plagiogramma staurophorum TaxID=1003089 RepID=A0A2U9NMD4_9STRA|nr:RNA polymerase beta' subunit [Plagiogramma staurophorum]AWT38240.1 RNA polymerase beta' subunit [Plagiogramma staurophorum]
MNNYTYQNRLISKKQLRQLLAWSFTNYDSMQACSLADELKYLGFKYASQAGISISIEDLKVPFVKNPMIKKANQEILDTEKIYLKGKITDVERFQKLIDTWNLTSEALKEQVIYYFKNYDPLNSVYIMAFSGARGNLSQVRQLVGMRGLMSDPSGEIMKLPIKKNFREGLTITDYLMSGYGARKGIVDTALKTANSGYLTRRLIDVAQDILIREKDCLTIHSLIISASINNSETTDLIYDKILGRILNKSIFDTQTKTLVSKLNTQITPQLVQIFKQKKIQEFYIRSPLTCNLYRAVCQKCYGWDLATENLIDIGEAIGILAGQSIGEPGTQLTMRTFHTGGIFTSETRQQIISPINGITKFSKNLKTVVIRTNRGEDVLVTKNSGSLILIPDKIDQEFTQIEIARNTILFPKSNQYIQKDTVIGELINLNKQIKTEIKPILSHTSGEIFIPNIKNKANLLNTNNLIWILSGQLYNSPLSSFINFYTDSKLNKNSYIFRTKLINHYSGYIEFINKKENLYERLIKIVNKKNLLLNSTLQKLSKPINKSNYILNFESFKYLLRIKVKSLKTYIQITNNKQFGTLLTNYFQTLTGGLCYYDLQNRLKLTQSNNQISYFWKSKECSKQKNVSRTLIWLGEETHKVNCEKTILLVEHGDFISKHFELIPGVFSKTAGIIIINQKNNIVQTITIKSGIVYEGRKFKNEAKKIYYPGEIIFSNISISEPSFCEHIIGKKLDQLLIRPIQLYESPSLRFGKKIFGKSLNILSLIKLKNKIGYSYKSNQIIRSTKNLNLIINKILFQDNKSFKNHSSLQLLNNPLTECVEFRITEKLRLNDFIPPHLKYKNVQSCFLVQKNQFVDCYTTLGYLEAITLDSLEIVKLKLKYQESKQILLISNDDCLKIKENKIIKKTKNDLIINSTNVAETGKILLQKDQRITLQKGRPYFFPNCRNETIVDKTNLQYKLISPDRIILNSKVERSIFVNYYDVSKILIQNAPKFKPFLKNRIGIKSEFSKLFLKKNGKLYSCLIPRFLKKFKISAKISESKLPKILRSKISTSTKVRKLHRTLLMQSSEIIKNKHKKIEKSKFQLTLVKFLEYPFKKSTKSVGLYSITEDFFEQDVNSIFCNPAEFIESGETIGLLNFEKEITGDIVQGLPRVEEILEARKKNLTIKRIPTNQKKGLLIQKTNLDPNFEFRKLGTPIKENERINPHKLLKIYFNSYGLMKVFLCDRTKHIKHNRLFDNFEGSYKSFKKVQSFILNSVQSVYQSQGVSINDKHLEIIIKQMTTKVLITYEGNTPLLRREVIDLYHIQYINKIIKINQKQVAYYVPLVLGITKAALNNPSFISAASFQETTRVLTKAAIEGRIDWLRGLKENIIIGHLIPAGTGSQNYRNSFRGSFNTSQRLKTDPNNVKIFNQTT